jgi:carboxymethylenebutenolidase
VSAPSRVSFVTREDRSAEGEWFAPAEPGPAIIVLHEWFGLVDETRRVCEELAAAGFLAFALDLYGGESTDDRARARELAQAAFSGPRPPGLRHSTPEALDAIGGAVDLLADDPDCTGHVGVMGFCLGGAVAIAASQVDGVAAVVAFYGLPPAERFDPEMAQCPIQGHFGRADTSVPVSRAEALRDAVIAAGGEMELHAYDAGHAFLRRSDPAVHVPAAADAAWARALEFLRRHLAA